MGIIRDLKGQRFGRLMVIDFAGLSKHRKATWSCICDCGNSKVIVGSSLTRGLTLSCGCYKSEKISDCRLENIVNIKFGRLLVVERSNKKDKYKNTYWKCICDCGNVVHVSAALLKSSQSTSCGCKNKERLSKEWVGENHPNWKGTTYLNIYLRGFLSEWKQDSLKKNEFRCAITGKKEKLKVHHLYPFYKIIKETLDLVNIPLYKSIDCYTPDELALIKETCIKLNYKYGLGVCLTEEIHKEFHLTYGKTDFTPENFQEFFYLKTGKEFNFPMKGDVMIV